VEVAMRSNVPAVVAALIVLPAWASNPGEPLDCSDWVILEAGVGCVTVLPHPSPEISTRTFGQGLDNESNGFLINGININPSFGAPGFSISRFELLKMNPQGIQTVVAYIEERCLPNGSADEIESIGVAFDPITGTLAMRFANRFSGAETYPYGWHKIGFQGFATLFDVLQSFVPLSGDLGFSVPYMPEGFQYADWFDTYYGTLATVGDWSQLQPLQCGYPASPPSVGDYLTVTDTLPTPAVGQGYYYVTAVTYQGQTRWGRRSSGGVLSGRDPAGLPGCAE
jgi:hypothetical protein